MGLHSPGSGGNSVPSPFLGRSHHPKPRSQGAGAAAGPCSLRPVPVLQSRGTIPQVSPGLGTPWERQGGVGASLKTRLGRRDGCEVRERAATSP